MHYIYVATIAFVVGFFCAVYFYLNPTPKTGELVKTKSCPVFIVKNAGPEASVNQPICKKT